MPDNNSPATRAELRAELQALETRITERMQQMQAELTERTQEFVRDAQTEMLRGFERFAAGENIRLRKLEADTSNIDMSATQRLGMLEQRVTDIERKLLLMRPPQPPQ